MILTDREIKIALARQIIIIDPPPADVAFQSTSVDLTLDPVISIFKKDDAPEVAGLERGKTIVDPTSPKFRVDTIIAAITENKKILPKDGFVLPHDHMILAWTREYIDLRGARVAARVEGKSSLARLGLSVHMTAPTIHAGFDGRIRLEVTNHGHFPIRLRPGMRICQLIFEQTFGTAEKEYSGQFAGQTVAKK